MFMLHYNQQDRILTKPCGPYPAGLFLCPESEVKRCQGNLSDHVAVQDVPT